MTAAVAVRERPILFSAPMVKALLDARKSQTRRVVTPLPPTETVALENIGGADWACIGNNGPNRTCPYGQTGERLWVRETWQVDAPRDGSWCDTQFFGCKGAPLSWIPKRFRRPEHVLYRSTWDGSDLHWRPSIFMPRWASRITLEITDVRVERVQDISRVDARAEGIEPCRHCKGYETKWGCMSGAVPPSGCCAAFASLWDSLNAKRGYGWDLNPWVWAITFRRVNQ